MITIDEVNNRMEEEFKGFSSQLPSYETITTKYNHFALTRKHEFSHYSCYIKSIGEGKVRIKIHPCVIERKGNLHMNYPNSKESKDLGKAPLVEDITVVLVEKEHAQKAIVLEF